MTSQASPVKLAWARGVTVGAAVLLSMVGIFQALQGISAIVNDVLFVKLGDYVYKFDVTAWGWIHLILGLVAIGLGIALFLGQRWAHIAALVVVVLQAVVQFMWLPYYPGWAIVIIILDVVIVWALVVQLDAARSPVSAQTP